ncbi:hypothetical protein ACFLQN_04815 [Candidatus Aenigmatarchaeota archaeon]
MLRKILRPLGYLAILGPIATSAIGCGTHPTVNYTQSAPTHAPRDSINRTPVVDTVYVLDILDDFYPARPDTAEADSSRWL